MNSNYTFYDYYGHKVELTFDKNYFSVNPKHVWVIWEYQNKWLLTIHPKRGFEFPGGKVEKNETPEIAAYREVYEETGARIEKLNYIGQYKVSNSLEHDSIIKNIYFAQINSIQNVEYFYETEGPILVSSLPENIHDHPDYSFIMKDRVLELALLKIEQSFNLNK